MHAAPPTSRRRHRLLAVVTGAIWVASVGGVAWTASGGGIGETPASSQATGVPQTTPSTTEAHRASEGCEREAVRAIARLVAARPSSSYEGSMQLAQERQRLSPQAYAAVQAVLNSVQTDFEQAGATGLGQIITAHMPTIRRACATS